MRRGIALCLALLAGSAAAADPVTQLRWLELDLREGLIERVLAGTNALEDGQMPEETRSELRLLRAYAKWGLGLPFADDASYLRDAAAGASPAVRGRIAGFFVAVGDREAAGRALPPVAEAGLQAEDFHRPAQRPRRSRGRTSRHEILDQYYGEVRGARVLRMDAAASSAQTGLRAGDVIIAIDDREVGGAADLARAIAAYRPGDTVQFTFFRDNAHYRTPFVLAAAVPDLRGLEHDALAQAVREHGPFARDLYALRAQGRDREALVRIAGRLVRDGYRPAWIGQAVKIATGLDPLPAVPDEAMRRASFGSFAFRDASDTGDLERAAREYQTALCHAPWWDSAHLNLALVHEARRDWASAARHLEYFLELSPHAPEAPQVRHKIYEMEYQMQR